MHNNTLYSGRLINSSVYIKRMGERTKIIISLSILFYNGMYFAQSPDTVADHGFFKNTSKNE